jgi:predicted nucleotidyltransferase
MAPIEQILSDLKASLQTLYGDRLQGVILFGSYARGDATEGSDIDVAVVLTDFASVGQEIFRMNQVVAPLCIARRVVISVLPLQADEVAHSREPVVQRIREEGIAA